MPPTSIKRLNVLVAGREELEERLLLESARLSDPEHSKVVWRHRLKEGPKDLALDRYAANPAFGYIVVPGYAITAQERGT